MAAEAEEEVIVSHGRSRLVTSPESAVTDDASVDGAEQ